MTISLRKSASRASGAERGIGGQEEERQHERSRAIAIANPAARRWASPLTGRCRSHPPRPRQTRGAASAAPPSSTTANSTDVPPEARAPNSTCEIELRKSGPSSIPAPNAGDDHRHQQPHRQPGADGEVEAEQGEERGGGHGGDDIRVSDLERENYTER